MDSSDNGEKGPAPEATADGSNGGSGFKVRDRRFWARDEDAEGEATTEENGGSVPTYVEQLRAEAEAARQEAAEKDAQLREYIAAYKEEVEVGLVRVKERLQREQERELERARGELALGLLEVLDNLQRSVAAAEESHNLEALIAGLHLVEAQFLSGLGTLGVTRIAAMGEPFDPAVHEAMGLIPVTEPDADGRVQEELQAGYRRGDHVIRPARVMVGKRSD